MVEGKITANSIARSNKAVGVGINKRQGESKKRQERTRECKSNYIRMVGSSTTNVPLETTWDNSHDGGIGRREVEIG